MSELCSVLDDMATIDLNALSEDALLDLVGELSTTANRVAATLTAAVRAADRREAYRRDGAVSMKAWLRAAAGWLRTRRRRRSPPDGGSSFSRRRQRPSPPARSVLPTPGSSGRA